VLKDDSVFVIFQLHDGNICYRNNGLCQCTEAWNTSTKAKGTLLLVYSVTNQ